MSEVVGGPIHEETMPFEEWVGRCVDWLAEWARIYHRDLRETTEERLLTIWPGMPPRSYAAVLMEMRRRGLLSEVKEPRDGFSQWKRDNGW